MRRILSILLFAAFLFPLVAPVLSSGAMAESGMPACCRRNGKHHCGMLQADKKQAESQTIQVSAPIEKCPFQQKSLGAVHHDFSTFAVATSNDVALLQQPTAASQADCLRRISFDRSRQKRGPPAILS